MYSQYLHIKQGTNDTSSINEEELMLDFNTYTFLRPMRKHLTNLVSRLTKREYHENLGKRIISKNVSSLPCWIKENFKMIPNKYSIGDNVEFFTLFGEILTGQIVALGKGRSKYNIMTTNGIIRSSHAHYIRYESFKIGTLVEVESRTWTGINKEGGRARIIAINYDDDTVDVKYVLGSRRERRLDKKFVKLPTELGQRKISRLCRVEGCRSFITDCKHTQPDESLIIKIQEAANAAAERAFKKIMQLRNSGSSIENMDSVAMPMNDCSNTTLGNISSAEHLVSRSPLSTNDTTASTTATKRIILASNTKTKKMPTRKKNGKKMNADSHIARDKFDFSHPSAKTMRQVLEQGQADGIYETELMTVATTAVARLQDATKYSTGVSNNKEKVDPARTEVLLPPAPLGRSASAPSRYVIDDSIITNIPQKRTVSITPSVTTEATLIRTPLLSNENPQITVTSVSLSNNIPEYISLRSVPSSSRRSDLTNTLLIIDNEEEEDEVVDEEDDNFIQPEGVIDKDITQKLKHLEELSTREQLNLFNIKCKKLEAANKKCVDYYYSKCNNLTTPTLSQCHIRVAYELMLFEYEFCIQFDKEYVDSKINDVINKLVKILNKKKKKQDKQGNYLLDNQEKEEYKKYRNISDNYYDSWKINRGNIIQILRSKQDEYKRCCGRNARYSAWELLELKEELGITTATTTTTKSSTATMQSTPYAMNNSNIIFDEENDSDNDDAIISNNNQPNHYRDVDDSSKGYERYLNNGKDSKHRSYQYLDEGDGLSKRKPGSGHSKVVVIRQGGSDTSSSINRSHPDGDVVMYDAYPNDHHHHRHHYGNNPRDYDSSVNSIRNKYESGYNNSNNSNNNSSSDEDDFIAEMYNDGENDDLDEQGDTPKVDHNNNNNNRNESYINNKQTKKTSVQFMSRQKHNNRKNSSINNNNINYRDVNEDDEESELESIPFMTANVNNTKAMTTSLLYYYQMLSNSKISSTEVLDYINKITTLFVIQSPLPTTIIPPAAVTNDDNSKIDCDIVLTNWLIDTSNNMQTEETNIKLLTVITVQNLRGNLFERNHDEVEVELRKDMSLLRQLWLQYAIKYPLFPAYFLEILEFYFPSQTILPHLIAKCMKNKRNYFIVFMKLKIDFFTSKMIPTSTSTYAQLQVKEIYYMIYSIIISTENRNQIIKFLKQSSQIIDTITNNNINNNNNSINNIFHIYIYLLKQSFDEKNNLRNSWQPLNAFLATNIIPTITPFPPPAAAANITTERKIATNTASASVAAAAAVATISNPNSLQNVILLFGFHSHGLLLLSTYVISNKKPMDMTSTSITTTSATTTSTRIASNWDNLSHILSLIYEVTPPQELLPLLNIISCLCILWDHIQDSTLILLTIIKYITISNEITPNKISTTTTSTNSSNDNYNIITENTTLDILETAELIIHQKFQDTLTSTSTINNILQKLISRSNTLIYHKSIQKYFQLYLNNAIMNYDTTSSSNNNIIIKRLSSKLLSSDFLFNIFNTKNINNGIIIINIIYKTVNTYNLHPSFLASQLHLNFLTLLKKYYNDNTDKFNNNNDYIFIFWYLWNQLYNPLYFDQLKVFYDISTTSTTSTTNTTTTTNNTENNLRLIFHRIREMFHCIGSEVSLDRETLGCYSDTSKLLLLIRCMIMATSIQQIIPSAFHLLSSASNNNNNNNNNTPNLIKNSNSFVNNNNNNNVNDSVSILWDYIDLIMESILSILPQNYSSTQRLFPIDSCHYKSAIYLLAALSALLRDSVYSYIDLFHSNLANNNGSNLNEIHNQSLFNKMMLTCSKLLPPLRAALKDTLTPGLPYDLCYELSSTIIETGSSLIRTSTEITEFLLGGDSGAITALCNLINKTAVKSSANNGRTVTTSSIGNCVAAATTSTTSPSGAMMVSIIGILRDLSQDLKQASSSSSCSLFSLSAKLGCLLWLPILNPTTSTKTNTNTITAANYPNIIITTLLIENAKSIVNYFITSLMLQKTMYITNNNHIIVNKIHSFQKYFIAVLPTLQQFISTNTINTAVSSNNYIEMKFILSLFEDVHNIDLTSPQANLLLLQLLFQRASERQIKNHNKIELDIISEIIFKDIKKIFSYLLTEATQAQRHQSYILKNEVHSLCMILWYELIPALGNSSDNIITYNWMFDNIINSQLPVIRQWLDRKQSEQHGQLRSTNNNPGSQNEIPEELRLIVSRMSCYFRGISWAPYTTSFKKWLIFLVLSSHIRSADFKYGRVVLSALALGLSMKNETNLSQYSMTMTSGSTQANALNNIIRSLRFIDDTNNNNNDGETDTINRVIVLDQLGGGEEVNLHWNSTLSNLRKSILCDDSLWENLRISNSSTNTTGNNNTVLAACTTPQMIMLRVDLAHEIVRLQKSTMTEIAQNGQYNNNYILESRKEEYMVFILAVTINTLQLARLCTGETLVAVDLNEFKSPSKAVENLTSNIENMIAFLSTITSCTTCPGCVLWRDTIHSMAKIICSYHNIREAQPHYVMKEGNHEMLAEDATMGQKNLFYQLCNSNIALIDFLKNSNKSNCDIYNTNNIAVVNGATKDNTCTISWECGSSNKQIIQYIQTHIDYLQNRVSFSKTGFQIENLALESLTSRWILLM